MTKYIIEIPDHVSSDDLFKVIRESQITPTFCISTAYDQLQSEYARGYNAACKSIRLRLGIDVITDRC